ncbi:MAG: VanW family protein [Microgenomates group bacterium Gr01-1014_93]|nr:MAG: VanW family protein [Microgenomates group bacterium Gr01-1014_93]
MHKKVKKKVALPILLGVILTALLILTFEVIFEDKFLPGVYVGDNNLIFLTKSQAYRLLDSRFSQRINTPVTLMYNNEAFKIDLSTTYAKLRTIDVINTAFEKGHEKSFDQKIFSQIKLLIFGATFAPQITIDLYKQIEQISKAVAKTPSDAKLTIEGELATNSGQIKIAEGKAGLELDNGELEKQLKNYIIFGKTPVLPVKVTKPKITTERAQIAKEFLERSFDDPVKLTFEEESWTLDPKTLLNFLSLEQEELVDNQKLKEYLSDLSEKINQPVVEGLFTFNPASRRVASFKPSQEGRQLNIEKTATLITLALEGKRAKNITLPVDITEPKIKTGDVNSLGIKELIGRGISHFAGSIPNRIYNVSLTASRINGVLVPPGEIFSFNQTIGDVSAATGYKQAYVIKSGRTVLDDGGGVCQDSTTLFRAVLNAGLPVVARTAHAYRVGYYEQGFPPGLDATVFHPSVDFKFKNDTGHHILTQAYTSGTTLYVDLYGTSDGRVSTISKSVITNSTPPPPELRQDDPELLKGEVKQVDFPAWGANVSFTRKVTRGGGTLINETYKSNYKAWQAVYLVGTKEN